MVPLPILAFPMEATMIVCLYELFSEKLWVIIIIWIGDNLEFSNNMSFVQDILILSCHIARSTYKYLLPVSLLRVLGESHSLHNFLTFSKSSSNKKWILTSSPRGCARSRLLIYLAILSYHTNAFTTNT